MTDYAQMTTPDLEAELFVTKELADNEKYEHNSPGVTPVFWEYVRRCVAIRKELDRRERAA